MLCVFYCCFVCFEQDKQFILSCCTFAFFILFSYVLCKFLFDFLFVFLSLGVVCIFTSLSYLLLCFCTLLVLFCGQITHVCSFLFFQVLANGAGSFFPVSVCFFFAFFARRTSADAKQIVCRPNCMVCTI